MEKNVNSAQRLCYYRNSSSQLQRLCLNQDPKTERLVFPGQQLLFWANPKDSLRVYPNEPSAPVLKLIPCSSLLAETTEDSSTPLYG
ncbi:MAG: DUF1830 domain-containing protein [Cyanobacteriota bacterium]|jgi:hypothetical protein